MEGKENQKADNGKLPEKSGSKKETHNPYHKIVLYSRKGPPSDEDYQKLARLWWSVENPNEKDVKDVIHEIKEKNIQLDLFPDNPDQPQLVVAAIDPENRKVRAVVNAFPSIIKVSGDNETVKFIQGEDKVNNYPNEIALQVVFLQNWRAFHLSNEEIELLKKKGQIPDQWESAAFEVVSEAIKYFNQNQGDQTFWVVGTGHTTIHPDGNEEESRANRFYRNILCNKLNVAKPIKVIGIPTKVPLEETPNTFVQRQYYLANGKLLLKSLSRIQPS